VKLREAHLRPIGCPLDSKTRPRHLYLQAGPPRWFHLARPIGPPSPEATESKVLRLNDLTHRCRVMHLGDGYVVRTYPGRFIGTRRLLSQCNANFGFDPKRRSLPDCSTVASTRTGARAPSIPSRFIAARTRQKTTAAEPSDTGEPHWAGSMENAIWRRCQHLLNGIGAAEIGRVVLCTECPVIFSQKTAANCR